MPVSNPPRDTSVTTLGGRSPWDSQPQEFGYRIDEVEGRLPEGLRGDLYRIGPGRFDVGAHPVAHIFDGDGMVSRLAIDENGVHFRNRYVRTREYRRTAAGGALGRGFGTQRAGGILANAFRPPANMSNTNVLVHDDNLYSLWEGGRPYRLDPHTLGTHGAESFGGALKRMGAFSAHPKRDPVTGEIYNFGLDFFPRPMIRCYRLTGGRLENIASVPIRQLGFVHDFALTERHLVFVIDPIVVTRPISAALGLSSIDRAMSYEPHLGTTIVLVPRAGGTPITVETDALFHFHVTNAYETDTATTVELVTHDPDRGWSGWNGHLRRYRTDPGPAFGGQLTRLTIDRRTTRVTREVLHDNGCEFPQLDPRHATRPHRYSYVAAASTPGGDPDSITTIDHSTGRNHTYTTSPGDTVCEPLFAPAEGGTEGDGWLLTFEHQPTTKRTRVLVLPADRPDRGPIATIPLRHHVPMTFHGAFVPARG
ncbi:carotenoid oxygenase family protein [Nocardia sp. BMG111209]|uniref:carotenoid oxygenase family protein n=1 Tax=Nocardia sp. BMG111209 TaxID=1160137 RepID=UPI0004775C91|nr:carotenoid oxygenase family protein [Nocardia sp. BMG111209]